MDFDESQRTRELRERLQAFMDEHVYPNEARFFRESMELGPWAVWPVVEELKPLARDADDGVTPTLTLCHFTANTSVTMPVAVRVATPNATNRFNPRCLLEPVSNDIDVRK